MTDSSLNQIPPKLEKLQPHEIRTPDELRQAIGDEAFKLLVNNPHLRELLKLESLKKEITSPKESHEKLKQERFEPVILLSANRGAVGNYYWKGASALHHLGKKYEFSKIYLASQKQLIDTPDLEYVKSFSTANHLDSYLQEEVDEAIRLANGKPVVFIFAGGLRFPKFRENLFLITPSKEEDWLSKDENKRGVPWTETEAVGKNNKAEFTEGKNWFRADSDEKIIDAINKIHELSTKK